MSSLNALRGFDRRKARNTGPKKFVDFTRLQLLLSEGNFVKNISYVSDPVKKTLQPRVFATTDSHITWLKNYCSVDNHLSVLGVDMTYKCGPFYVTAATIKHPFFVQKANPRVHPGIVVALSTSGTKGYEDYKFLSERIRQYIGEGSLIYGTDGEPAIEKAFEDVFPIEDVAPGKMCIHLRCFEHVKNDILNYLRDQHMSVMEREKIMKQLLGSEFNGVRYFYVFFKYFSSVYFRRFLIKLLSTTKLTVSTSVKYFNLSYSFITLHNILFF